MGVVCSTSFFLSIGAQKNVTFDHADSLFDLYNAINSKKFFFKNSWTKGINERIGGLMPALHHAINMNNKKAIKKLLQHGANVLVFIEDPDELFHQFNALHLATAFGYIDIVLLLFKHSFSKFDINIPVGNDNKKGMAGFTALHVAAYFQHRALVELLLKKGASVHIKTHEGNKLFPGFKPFEVTNDQQIRDILIKREKKILFKEERNNPDGPFFPHLYGTSEIPLSPVKNVLQYKK